VLHIIQEGFYRPLTIFYYCGGETYSPNGIMVLDWLMN
jgi:hypothetical protein